MNKYYFDLSYKNKTFYLNDIDIVDTKLYNKNNKREEWNFVMNIHINKSVNKSLKDDEVNINIEVAENSNKIENIIEYIKEYDNKKIVVYDGYNMIQINVDDIMYFYSDGNYNFCKTKDKEYRVKSKLYEIEKMSRDFLRISKSCIINIKQVKSFDIGENRNIIVKFYDNSEQYVSRRKIKEVMNYLDERMM